MIAPDTFLEVKNDGIYVNGSKLPDIAQLQQDFIALKNNPAYELIIAHIKTQGYKDGFLDSKSWEATIAGKAWSGCGRSTEMLVESIISYKG